MVENVTGNEGREGGHFNKSNQHELNWGFLGGSDSKVSACNAGDPGSIPGTSAIEGNGYPLQSSCLENPTNRGAWWATVHGITKSWTRATNTTTTS